MRSLRLLAFLAPLLLPGESTAQPPEVLGPPSAFDAYHDFHPRNGELVRYEE